MSNNPSKVEPSCLFPDIRYLEVPRSPGSECTDTTDQQIADKLNNDFAVQFASETRDIAKAKYHKKVGVLLFSWSKESNACLDTTKEVKLLGDVFRQKYNYSVHEKWLSVKPEAKLPKHQLSLHFAQFIKEEDAKDALLIVYYGGHGFRGPQHEGLRIMGGNAADDFRTSTNEIVLANSIKHFHEAEADVLLILDCCFAGYLTRDFQDDGVGDKIFEFIGSSGQNQVARGPGSTSFTTALTRALHELASEKREGFTVTTLLNKIQSLDSFRDNRQTPVSSELGMQPSYRRLKIVRTPTLRTPPEDDDVKRADSDGGVRFYLNLQYRLTDKPTSEDITRLSRACKSLVQNSQLPLQQVVWNGISETSNDVELAKAVTRKWASVVMGRRLAQGDLTTSLPIASSLAAEQAREKKKLEHMSGRIDRLYDFVIARYKRTAMTSIAIAFILGSIVARRRDIVRLMLAGRS